jgi:hypothetical protein
VKIEGGLVILLLVVVWLIALLPFALHRFSEWRMGASVARFGCQNRAFGRAMPAPARPAQGAQGTPAAIGAPMPGSGEQIDDYRTAIGRPVPTTRHAVQAAKRRDRERALQLMARRRRTLESLLLVLAGSVVFGAIPVLRFLWYISLTAFALTTAYIGLLIWFRQSAERAADAWERAEKVVPIRRLVDRADRAAPSVTSFAPMRPAFVLVDAPA